MAAWMVAYWPGTNRSAADAALVATKAAAMARQNPDGRTVGVFMMERLLEIPGESPDLQCKRGERPAAIEIPPIGDSASASGLRRPARISPENQL